MKYSCLVALVFLLCLLGCKAKVPVAPAIPKNTFVLLPETDGRVGAITIHNSAGSADLDKGYSAVQVDQSTKAPGPAYLLTPAQVEQTFGSALSVLPDAEKSFLVYFEVGKEDFTPESLAVLNEVLNEIKARASTDVSVVGHADTSGDSATNYQLAVRRANKVSASLVSMGVDPHIVSVASHGDADLLVKTGRGVAESRNRRVEILVR